MADANCTQTSKTCTVCRIDKPLTDFHKHSHFKLDGRRATCKACNKAKRQTPEERARGVRLSLAWQTRNPEKNKEYRRAYAVVNRDYMLAACADWRSKNREYHRALATAWNQRNPEAVLHRNLQRRVREANCTGEHTLQEWRERLEYFGRTCGYCLRHESDCGKLTKDHLIALDMGGSNDIENIVPACKSCNFTKGPRPLWRALQLGV